VTDVRPWLEAGDTPAHLRDILREAQPSRPLPARTQARSRQRLLAASVLPVAASLVFWVKSIALGAALGSIVAVGVYAPKFRSSTVKSEAPTSQPAPRATGAPRSVLYAMAAGVDDAGSPPTQPAHSSAVTSPRSSAAVLPSAGPSQLSRETQLLERARQLMSSDARQALSSLDAHRREFPNGALELERELMAVDALLKLGQRDAALRRAAQLRARAPGSIYEQRLTRLLE
jgi:hypothetical protein